MEMDHKIGTVEGQKEDKQKIAMKDLLHNLIQRKIQEKFKKTNNEIDSNNDNPRTD
jgi:hypothetical protein